MTHHWRLQEIDCESFQRSQAEIERRLRERDERRKRQEPEQGDPPDTPQDERP